MCVILLWPSKITCSLILMQNVLNVWVFEDNLIEKLVFGRFWLNYSVFEKLLISYSCISFMKHYALRSFCIKLLCFSKKFDFFFFFRFSILDQIFFMHHLCLGFTCIALIFCIHLAILQSYLSLFSHITCIHFANLGTQLDLKID